MTFNGLLNRILRVSMDVEHNEKANKAAVTCGK